jgi:predicted nucleotidyltransferase
MSLRTVFKEREKEKKSLRKAAITDVQRLAVLLRKRFQFESLYICGSILTDDFRSHSDIDIVVKGLRVEDFFKAHAFLMKESRYEIDLKPFEDLTEDFREKVLIRGMKVE